MRASGKKLTLYRQICIQIRKIKSILLICATVMLVTNGDAQRITSYGDDVGTLDGIMKAFYQVTTVKKGQMPSYPRDSLLHYPGALVGGVSVDRKGNKKIHTMTLKKFHEVSDVEMSRTGYEEHEIARKVQQFGAIYHVWSTYETRYEAGGPLIERGIDSIELFYDGTRFWILSWFYDNERKDNPLPQS